jgi:bacterial/archaeal transporter family protein
MKPALLSAWQIWALLSACFAALTAIFAKVGVENINPDLATFIRTVVVLLAFSVLLFFTGQVVVPSAVSSKTWLFLVLSGLATGASWLCYFRALNSAPPR